MNNKPRRHYPIVDQSPTHRAVICQVCDEQQIQCRAHTAVSPCGCCQLSPQFRQKIRPDYFTPHVLLLLSTYFLYCCCKLRHFWFHWPGVTPGSSGAMALDSWIPGLSQMDCFPGKFDEGDSELWTDRLTRLLDGKLLLLSFVFD